MPTFRRGFGPVSAAQVRAAEERLGVTLPDDYRQFLCTINGGRPKPNCFLVSARGPALVDMLYGVRGEPAHFDLEYEQEQATLWDPLSTPALAGPPAVVHRR